MRNNLEWFLSRRLVLLFFLFNFIAFLPRYVRKIFILEYSHHDINLKLYGTYSHNLMISSPSLPCAYTITNPTMCTACKQIPFGIAQIGKAFRNEITPRNFIFRSREFEQMEIEYFIPDGDEDWGPVRFLTYFR